MDRAALEHLLRAASAISNEREFVVIGSQAVLGQFPDAPEALLVSLEADIYPRYAPERVSIYRRGKVCSQPKRQEVECSPSR
jgi:hypothetical protein